MAPAQTSVKFYTMLTNPQSVLVWICRTYMSRGERMRHIAGRPVRTRLLIFNLLGDYLHPRRASFSTSGLVRVLDVLEVNERAVRSALSRMKQRGWLSSERVGRRSRYRLTQRGRDLLEEGDRRLFGPRPTHWDGHWNVVTYSLPSRKRAQRRKLRARLAWLGYGTLAPGTMIAARGQNDQVRARIEDLGIEQYVQGFSRARLRGWTDAELVRRCWDLEALNRAYRNFVERHRPEFERLKTVGGRLDPKGCFVRRFWLTYEYLSYPSRDPYLPPELLPEKWNGDQAAILFSAYRELLRGSAQTYIDSHLGLEPRAVDGAAVKSEGARWGEVKTVRSVNDRRGLHVLASAERSVP